MVYIPVDQKSLLRAIRKAVKAAGGRRIGLRKFVTFSKITHGEILKHYARWTDALRAAGFDPAAHNTRIDSEDLLADWASLAGKLRRLPTASEYNLHGAYEVSTMSKRFGSWNRVPLAFQSFATKRPKWRRLLKKLPSLTETLQRRARTSRPRRGLSLHRHPGRPAYGLPIVFDALLHAPVNELGVICLFSMMAKRLGFFIDGLQAAFPDCYAKRPLGGGAWQHVAIEFEFESRSFRHHGHPPDGCDIIVCWNHNWADCPKNLQVIELSEEIKRLAGKNAPCSHVPVGRSVADS
jgi:hypothetical protein